MLKAFEDRSRFFWIITSILLVMLLGLLDYQTGNDYSFSLFYLIPITLTTWFAKPSLGLFIALLSAATWLTADMAVGEDYAHPGIYFWNTLIRLGFFVIVTYLLSELHKTQSTVRALSRTDHLTGTINSRYFQELLGIELSRTNRYGRPFTLVYLDLDNFKQVNDRFGHDEGDQLIKFIAEEIKRQLRNTDIVSRLGGDEFSILLPEAGQQEARLIMSKLHKRLMEQLSSKYPFLTFSAGVVTYIAAPNSVANAIKIVDELMYSVKNGAKNDVEYSIYTG